MTLIGITVRSWLYEGSCALENMVLGMEERAVRDGGNHLSTDEFDACLAIVVCRIGSNTFAHLGQIVGLYRGDARQIWDRSKDCGPPDGETCRPQHFSLFDHRARSARGTRLSRNSS